MKHKSTTKLFTFLLVLTLIVTLLPISALADADICDEFEYTDNGNGTCTVLGYIGSSTDITIPNKLNDLTVTTIGVDAFKDKGLTSVTLPQGLKVISEHAFQNNTLSAVSIPISVTNIGHGAFVNNTLTEFTLPMPEEGYISKWHDSTNTMYGGDTVPANEEEYTWMSTDLIYNYYTYNDDLKLICIYQYNGRGGDVVIPETIDGYTVYIIGSDTFKNKGLTSVTLPQTVMEIRSDAFANNASLTSFQLPAAYKGYENTWIDHSDNEYSSGATVTDFSTDYNAKLAFTHSDGGAVIMSHITDGGNVTVPSKIGELTVYSIYDDVYFDANITKITLPDTITYIGDWAFERNNITSVTLPASIKHIGFWAFADNSNLESFNLPNAPTGYTSYWTEYERSGGEVCSVTSEEEMAPATTRPPVITNEVNGGYTVTHFSNAYEWDRNEPNKYTITFKDADGTVIKTVTQDYGTEIEYPQLAAKEGYTAGWNSNPETVPAENTTITAVYTANQYSVTFKDSDGTVLKTAKVDFGTAIEYPADPTKKGYIFNGWDSDIETVPAKDITITASYIPAEAPRGNITGTLLDSDGNPIAGKTVKLHSKVVTTVTDSKGRFTFTDVPLVDHELIIESSEGTELGRYGLSFGKSDSTSYSVDETDVDVNVTSNTVAIDILVNVSESGEVSIEKITFAENPQTGDVETASTWIVWIILAVFIAAVALIIWRNSAVQK